MFMVILAGKYSLGFDSYLLSLKQVGFSVTIINSMKYYQCKDLCTSGLLPIPSWCLLGFSVCHVPLGLVLGPVVMGVVVGRRRCLPVWSSIEDVRVLGGEEKGGGRSQVVGG